MAIAVMVVAQNVSVSKAVVPKLGPAMIANVAIYTAGIARIKAVVMNAVPHAYVQSVMILGNASIVNDAMTIATRAEVMTVDAVSIAVRIVIQYVVKKTVTITWIVRNA